MQVTTNIRILFIQIYFRTCFCMVHVYLENYVCKIITVELFFTDTSLL